MRRILILCAGSLALAACENRTFDLDMRGLGKGFNTAESVNVQTAQRPQPDARGVISYPSYQVAVAQPGDRVANIASRVGVPADELARYNGIPMETVLNAGELLALPRRVATATTATVAAPGAVDVQTLAGNAISRSGGSSAPTPAGTVQAGKEPVRHQVARGETAYSIARLYGVSVKSLADWNGLGADMTVRTGQYLLIPVVVGAAAPPVETATTTTAPGVGSPTPLPPSSTAPLPDEKTVPPAKQTAAAKPEGAPASPNLGAQATAASASNARMVTPVSGSIVRDFRKGKNDGIDISATPGASVKAADAGTVAAITKDTDNVPIIVIRHDGGVLTVYANVDGVQVKKGQRVGRGESIARVRGGDSSFLHFEVREGVDAVDPSTYLK
ncbi:peptidoglycan DD-metalloendopeptidase family protein [Tropicimonas sp.]|uniref:peptidoglycan DD-metalloendopeptidase family protein n=1 Tax=Tropicimonas sp. TaxID=2067044 RepID=UPI003A89E54B